MSKCLSIKTGENTLEPMARANDVATAVKLAVLQKQANQSFAPNTKMIITESGDWTAPVTGTYKVTLINGGDGAKGGNLSNNKARTVYGGSSGSTRVEFIKLVKGQKVDVVIGAGGTGVRETGSQFGGQTKFGDIQIEVANGQAPSENYFESDVTYREIRVYGGGFGAGSPNTTNGNAMWYGAGGGGHLHTNTISYIGNGYQGCVIVEYFDPDKAVLPTINDTDLIPFIELLQRVENIEKALMESRMYNTEEWIEESGTWTAPVDGYYEVMVIGGGDGVHYIPVINTLQAGSSGSYGTKLFYLKKGDVISVTVGAGGQHYIDGVGSVSIKYGGITKFGDLLSSYEFLSAQAGSTITFPGSDTTREFWAFGGGLCSNRNADGSAYFTVDGKYYGAGGGGRTGQSYNTDETRQLGDGYQGVIRLRYYDSNKENN